MPYLKNDIIMKIEIQKLECLSQISSAIIDEPTLALADFGIERDSNTNLLTYTGNVDSKVNTQYSPIVDILSEFMGQSVTATGTALSTIGLVAGVTGVGISAIGIVVAAAPSILLWGIKKYKEKKREQEQKDRMYKELIAKQQSAINKQLQVNRELEERLRDQKAEIEQMKKIIAELQHKLKNLTEIFELLTEQLNQFIPAA